MSKPIKPGDVVTYPTKLGCSNAFYVSDVVGDEAYLHHPTDFSVYIKCKLSELNLEPAMLRNNLERHIEYVAKNLSLLDYNNVSDFSCVKTFYSIRRHLPNKQKNVFYSICGDLAEIKFSGDVHAACEFIKANKHSLDSFNIRWVNKFSNLIEDPSKIQYKNQRQSIFNIVGYLIADLELTIV